MFTRISNGWKLAQESWQVLKLDRELLVFPLVSGIACLLVLASFALPLWGSGYATALLEFSSKEVLWLSAVATMAWSQRLEAI
ncbi:MAG: hypothetical protein KY475_16785 [Planctomycetes bacterium]|nr:hypothetical protein [Planctomycetota bacterium]